MSGMGLAQMSDERPKCNGKLFSRALIYDRSVFEGLRVGLPHYGIVRVVVIQGHANGGPGMYNQGGHLIP
jgi:hypothetical protein